VPAADGPFPLVVLVHGGYWRPVYDLTLEKDVAAFLAAQGFLVWNIDYAPAGTPWPTTLTDVAAAYDHGARDPRVDPARIAVVGHSAGGHLALWLASRQAGTPGGAPSVRPALVVAQAPVACLALAWEQRLGDGAVELFAGGSPASFPERYAEADPLALLPITTPTVLVHGADDDVVPLSQSQTYASASQARLVVVPGGHFEHLDPTSEAIVALRDALGLLQPG
jgi:acetyl esterase/lipase